LVFVIQSVIFPAFPEDTGPFIGEGAQGGLEAVAGGFALLEVGAGPDGVFDGFLGPFYEGLPGVFVAAEPSVDFAHLSALVSDRSDSDGRGKVLGQGAAVGVAGEGDVQTRSEGRAGAGQGLDHCRVGLGGEAVGDRLVVAQETCVEGFDLVDDDRDFEQVGDRFLGREQHKIFDHALAGFPAGCTAAAVFLEEGFDFGELGFAQRLGRRPAAQESEIHAPPEIFVHEREGLRVVTFEDRLEAVGQAGALVDEFATALAESVELFNFIGHGRPGGEFVAMMQDIESLVVGVGAVGAGVRNDQRAPVRPGCGGIERIDRRGLPGREESQQVGRGLFEGDQQPDAGMFGLELRPPRVEFLGLGADHLFMDLAGLNAEQRDGGGRIGTVQRDDQLSGWD